MTRTGSDAVNGVIIIIVLVELEWQSSISCVLSFHPFLEPSQHLYCRQFLTDLQKEDAHIVSVIMFYGRAGGGTNTININAFDLAKFSSH